jgi:hypothetical protein
MYMFLMTHGVAGHEGCSERVVCLHSHDAKAGPPTSPLRVLRASWSGAVCLGFEGKSTILFAAPSNLCC